MTFDSFNAVVFATAFLVPGFIWSAVISMLVPRRARATELRFLEFFTLSCINHGLWIWLTFPILSCAFPAAHPMATGLALLVVMLVSPVVLGLLTSRLLQRNWMKAFLGRFGFRTIHPVPTAWDYHFSRALPYWVVVTLKDGAHVYGLFGFHSFAGDDPAERDLYVESVFRPVENGEWAPVEDSAGILIKADQLAAIEFRKLAEFSYDRQQ